MAITPLWGSNEYASYVAQLFYDADIDTRRDILTHKVTKHSERSYLESVFTKVRSLMHIAPNSIKFTAETTDNHLGDGVVVLRFDQHIKVALIEAKFVRNLRDFDKQQSKKNTASHFYTQLGKQELWKQQLACFEWFIIPEKIGTKSPPLDRDGSTCIWQCNIYDAARNPFDIWDLGDILNKKSHLKSLKEIITDIIMCREGSLIKVKSNETDVTITNTVNKKLKLNVPIPRVGQHKELYENRIKEFLLDEGYSFFQYYEMD